MDPVSRRFVWKHINEIKKGRVVLLTTHAMEEADLLADMVAIMRKGELAAWGSPLQLKTAHGSALQFSVIVDKADVASTVEKIQSRFIGVEQWIVVNAGEAGNVTVSIKQIQEHSTDEGVCVEALTNFVAWLEDSETSGVTEYGFSNSSLEEVFLKVTEGDTEDLQTHANVIVQHEDNTVESLSLPPSEFSNNVAAYQSQLSVLGQVQALVWQYFIRSWTGSRSIGNWVMFGTFISISLLLVVWLSSVGSPILVVPVIFASLILLSICNGMYADRAEGLFLLMQTHGLLRASYLIGTTAYSLSIALIYHIILMTLLYLTPFFREPIPCDPLKEINQYCDTFPKFGKRNQIDLSMAQDVSWLVEGVDVSILTDDWGSIRILAYPSPSGYWMVFCAAAFFSLTIPGVALAGSYFPGHKFALVLIVTLLLGASITPMVVSLLAKLNIIILESDQDVEACLNDLLPRRVCNETVISVNTSDIFPASASEDFLNCVGLAINDLSNLCIPPYASLLPQFGLFQMLSLALNANIKFHTVPAEFAETVLLPSIKGGHCSGNTCSFPALRTIYWKFAGWETLGAVILITVGILVVLLVAFPNTGVQNVKSLIKSYFEHVKSLMFCQLAGKETRPFPKEQFQKREEVLLERESVKKIVQPFMSTSDSELPHIADHSIIPREELPPVLMYKLSKVYPSFGRLPPKVALKSLDLHVPKGQVLGFLGKNGAGTFSCLVDMTSP